jgi:HAD superfamily hydrolase (TIGR01484 family)
MQDLLSQPFAAVRLVATDMDGTLTQKGKFTPALLQALTDLETAGIQVLIVTGRSAGWVSGLVSYLPVVGAIAENGGLFYDGSESEPKLLVPIPDLVNHRQQLAKLFAGLQTEFPKIQESVDNQFRLTDWTFDIQGLTLAELKGLGDRCHAQGWGFTYSTVQCHLRLLQQDKAIGLSQVLSQYFPPYAANQIVTVGDSPNDESLFESDRFPLSVGVANVQHYATQLVHKPLYITKAAEAAGFCELAQLLLTSTSTA